MVLGMLSGASLTTNRQRDFAEDADFRAISRPKRIAVTVISAVLIPSMIVAFRGLGARLGPKHGYFAAFLVYWVGWCLLFPLWILGWQGIRAAFARSHAPASRMPIRNWWLLALPPLLGGAFVFPTAIRRAGPSVVVTSAGLALANAAGEELLWPGIFLRAFPHRATLGHVYPSLAFGIWHVAPQTLLPSAHPGGSATFVAFATTFGLIYSRIAARTGSLCWTTLSHFLLDFSGLGAQVYFRKP